MLDDKPVLMWFSAEWCKPCEGMKHIINELIEERTEINFVKVNIDEDQEAAATFHVRSIPTFILLKNDKVVATQIGVTSKLGMESFLET